MDRNPFFRPNPRFSIWLKTAISEIFGCARNGTSVNKIIMFNTIDTFAILLLWSDLGLTRNPSKSAFFEIFLLYDCFPLNSYCNAPNLPQPKGKELHRLKRQFWKWHDQGNNSGGCRVLGCDKGANKNRLTVTGLGWVLPGWAITSRDWCVWRTDCCSGGGLGLHYSPDLYVFPTV